MRSLIQTPLRTAFSLPAFHPGQEALAKRLKRFNVVRCGRRWGKTTFGLDYLLTDLGGRPGAAMARVPVAHFAPTNKLLLESWEVANATLGPVIRKRIEVNHQIFLQNGGRLDYWSLESRNPARSRKYAKIVVDEAAHVPDLKEKYSLNIRAVLTDYAGHALFISTPSGKNYFHELDQRSLTRPTWASFHAPSRQNPFLPAGEIEEARLDMPSLMFRQEYEAEYVDFAGALVKPEWCQVGRTVDDCPIILGVDLAISSKQTADYTAIVAMQREHSGKIYIRGATRFRLPFNRILEQIEAAAVRYRPVLIIIEDVQFQAAVVQERLRTTSLPVLGWKPDRDKLCRFLPLVARYEQGLVYHDADLPPGFQDEVVSFTGNKDAHDDYIDAASCAYHGLGIGSGQMVASAGRFESQEQQARAYMAGVGFAMPNPDWYLH
jgi:predicted phage terminase large subunit-like protein